VSGFSADWLALREPFDTAARADALVAALRRRLRGAQTAEPLEVVDLGAGAGSNLRFLAPRLGGRQRWRLVDHDAALLAAAEGRTRAWAAERGATCEARGDALLVRQRDLELAVVTERRDLRSLADLALPEDGLVTAAALLDLVSAAWLEALAERCSTARATICFALTYDGRTVCTPPDPEDSSALALFNAHQRGDKGFGAALGPDAARTAAATFARRGYETASAASDWRIDAASMAMQHALLDGWLAAATEIAPARRAELERWHSRRASHAAAERSTLTVGHVDLVGWPRGASSRPQPAR
jgi:hypothetical protein